MSFLCLRRIYKNYLINNYLIQIQFANYAAKAGSQSTGKKRFRLPVEEKDAKRLVEYVNGSNFFKEGEDIKIKEDKEYPDWIWTMRLDPPPGLEAYDPKTKEYWERLAFLSLIRQKRLQKVKPKVKKVVAPELKANAEWYNKIKVRALAADNFDPGWNIEDADEEIDRQLYLKPRSIDEEEIFSDEIYLPPKYH